MTILVTDEHGLEFLTFVQGDAGFRPAQGQVNSADVGFFWDLVADDLHRLPESDREAVESVWRGLLQIFAAELADAAYVDQLKSLIEAPIVRERKWLKYEVLRTIKLSAGHEELVEELPGSAAFLRLPGDAETTVLTLGLIQGAQATSLSIPLRSAAAPLSALRFSWTGSLAASVEDTWVLLGYGGDTERGICIPGLFVAVSTGGQVQVMSVSGVKEVTTYELGNDPIDPSVDFTVDMWWSGETHRLEVVITHSGGEETWSRVLSWGGVLTRWCMTSPALGIPGYPQRRDPLVVSPRSVEFVDPSVSTNTRFVPSLQASPSDDEEFLRSGMDFVLREVAGGAYLSFFDQPGTSYYAESVGLDMGMLKKLWGPLTGVHRFLSDNDSEVLRNQIYGALAGLALGPSIPHLSAAVSALTGAPIAMRPGRVVLFFDASGSPAIVVQEAGRRRAYYYPEGMEVAVSLGEEVQPLQPLTRIDAVMDWQRNPQMFNHLGLRSELEKASSILVRVHASTLRMQDDGGEVLLQSVTEYLKRALAMWVGVARVFVSVVRPLIESLQLGDATTFASLLYLREAFTDAPDVRYDSSDGFTFDQDSPELTFDMDEDILWADLMEFAFTNNGPTDPISLDALGDTYEISDGETITVREAG